MEYLGLVCLRGSSILGSFGFLKREYRHWQSYFFFSVRLLSVVRVFFVPVTTANDLRFLYQILSITLFSYLNSWERGSISLSMLSAKQGNYWYHFITSLVWRGLWLGIEPGPPALETSTLPLGYRGGGVEQWVACLIRNMLVVGSNSIKCSRCFLWQENLPSLLNSGWFQDRIWGWFHNRTKINYKHYGRVT